mmetsp:Transcript_3129/g.7224  ORF Transcript_3129/g.7224 Transcript_3129/m.7224 type:complete len:350 (-) Transcript_3129:76-1125(-)
MMGGYPSASCAGEDRSPSRRQLDMPGIFAPAAPEVGARAGISECAALTCSICFNIFEEPVTLPLCGHSFCLRCVRGVAACPVCRGPIVEELPPVPNYTLRALLEEMQLSRPCVEIAACADGWQQLRVKARIHQRCMACEEYHCDGIFGFCSVCLDAIRRMSTRRLLTADDIFRTLPVEEVLEKTRQANYQAKLFSSLEYQRRYLDGFIPPLPQPVFMPGPMFRSLVGSVKKGLEPQALAAKLSELEHPVLSSEQSESLLEVLLQAVADPSRLYEYEHIICSRVLDFWNLAGNTTGGCYYGLTYVEDARTLTQGDVKEQILLRWHRNSQAFPEACMDRKTQEFMRRKLQA